MEVLVRTFNGTGGDGSMFLGCGVVIGLIGIAWIAQGLGRTRALIIDARGIGGYTLFGPKRFNWADVDRVEINWHGSYKRQLTVHGKMGAPSVGYGVTGIPISIGRIDRKEAEVIAAIERFGPDVPVVDLGGHPSFLIILLQKLSALWEQALARR